MKIQGLGKIYILHYFAFNDRKAYLDSELKKQNIEDAVIFETSYKNKQLTKKQRSQYDSSNEAWDDRIKVIGRIIASANRPLKDNEIRVTLQHLSLLKKIAAKTKQEVYMIAEDDVLINNKFPERLNLLIKKLSRVEWDVCYIGKGGLLIAPGPSRNTDDITLYPAPSKSSIGASSYLVTPKSAKKILKIMKKFTLPIDSEYSYIQKKYDLKVFWAFPFLTKEGSIEGFYSSGNRKTSKTQKAKKMLKIAEKISPRLSDQLARIFVIILNIKNKILYGNKLS